MIVTLLDVKVAKMKNKPFYLSKKEVKNLRKNKKQLSKYALKEISERLKRIEDKLDNSLFFLDKSSTLDIKGFWNKTKI